MDKKVDKQRNSNRLKKLGGCTGKGFTPGKSGNPSGGPRFKTAEAMLRLILNRKPSGQLKKILTQLKVTDLDTSKPAIELICEVAVGCALAGDRMFIKDIFNRVYGKVPERIADPDGNAIPFTFVFNANSDDDD